MRVQAMSIYEVMIISPDDDAASVREYIDAFEAAFKYYEVGDFILAQGAFATCLAQRPLDPVAMMLKTRCESLRLSDLPHDWDGSYTALDK